MGIKRVCVIGAGTMGSGIAAHLANLGFQVTLLDATRERVADAFERARNARPPHFYTPHRADNVRLGSTAENLEWVREADWVCEAVVEKSEIKKALYAQLDPLLREDTMVSTNTSGLEISLLAEGRSESFRKRFLGTHFFNPPRYLKLLELIPTDETDPEVVASMSEFLENHVARRVIIAKDTPGFIANRFGMWSMYHAIHVAEQLGLSIEEVDLITGPFLGRPKSASFRLNDIVGLDVMNDIASNLLQRCPHDPHTPSLRTPPSMAGMLSRGWIGEKSGHGYYRREGKEFHALDLRTFEYRPRREVSIPSLEALSKLPLGERIRLALELNEPAGEYLRRYLVPTLRYAEWLKEEISHSVLDFDRVMEWGFGWQAGPFAMLDAVGLSEAPYYRDGSERSFEGPYITIPKNPQYATLADFPVVDKGEAHVRRDLGDGVTALALTTKMGVVTLQAIDELTAVLKGGLPGPVVFTSEVRSFSAGFDLKFLLQAIDEGDFTAIDRALTRLQYLGELFEKVPSVAAVFGHCLGGGLELAMSCSHIVAHPETNIGLPELKVGLIPGGRGNALMRLRNQFTAARLTDAAMTLARAEVAPTPEHARVLGYLKPTDVTCFHPDRLIFEAKKLALNAYPALRPDWQPVAGPLLGMIDQAMDAAHRKGELTEYDLNIAYRTKLIFARTTNYEDSLLKEREEFLELCRHPFTVARIRNMVETNRPLRN